MLRGEYLFAVVWIIFIILLIQGIREKNKGKIIVSSIFVAFPFLFLAWILYLLLTNTGV